jgi:hypothetical protein
MYYDWSRITEPLLNIPLEQALREIRKARKVLDLFEDELLERRTES